MALNIDKTNWKKIKLGDVAFEYGKRINNPSESEFDRFVGSSNIGQWDFRVKSWEATDSVTSTMKLFEPNDYLLVRRSLYASDFRERAPRADFSGVCSGDILTIKENPELIADGFLIGIFNSPALWKFVVANASGSITRRIKWKDLSSYEFLLPPKEEQCKIAELLWALEEVIENEHNLERKLKIARDVFFENLINESKGKEAFLSQILIPKTTKSQIPHSRDKYIGLEHIESGEFESKSFMNSEDVKAQCNVVNKGDLCYSKLRPYLDKAIIATFDAVSTTELLIYNTKFVSKDYVLYHLHSRPFLNYIIGQGFGTKMPRVSHRIIGDYSILIPDNERLILDKMDEFLKNSKSIQTKINSSKALQKSIISEIF